MNVAELFQQVDESIGSCLTSYATNADVVFRERFGSALVQALYQPLNKILNDIHTITSTLLMVSEDSNSSVRIHLLEKIPEIFSRCRELDCQDLDYFLFDRLLDIVLQYLKDEDAHLRKYAFFAIKHLLDKNLLDVGRIESKVCPAIVECTRILCNEQQQIDLPQLMEQLIRIVGRDKTQELFLDRFIEMCADNTYHTRKSCADLFPVICQVMGTEITEKQLLPIFMQMCEDSEWGVRNAAAESFTKVALMCSLYIRQKHLAPLLYKLMNDSNRWVSFSAFKFLGQFISSFAQPCITGLAYTNQGELFITNAADFHITPESDLELFNNFKHYTKMFNESMVSTQNLPLHEPSRSDYEAAVLNTNPYGKFLTPEPFANIGFIPNSTLPPPPPPPPLISAAAATASTTTTPPPPPPSLLENLSIDDDNTTSSISNVIHVNNSSSISSSSSLSSSPYKNNKSPFGGYNNNNMNNNNNNLSSSSTNLWPHLKNLKTNNNEAVIESTSVVINSTPCEGATDQLGTTKPTTTTTVADEQNNGIATDNNNSNAAETTPTSTNADDKHKFSTSSDGSGSGGGSSGGGGGVADEYKHNWRFLRPLGLPSIIKSAIKNREEMGGGSRLHNTNNKSNNNNNSSTPKMSLIMPKTNEMPIETPSIENAPQSLDFQLNNNTTTTTTTTVTTIQKDKDFPFMDNRPNYHTDTNQNNDIIKNNDDDQGQDYWCDDWMGGIIDDQRATINDETSIDSITNNDDDETLKQYNSANYWYVCPEDIYRDVLKYRLIPNSNAYKDDVRKVKIQELKVTSVQLQQPGEVPPPLFKQDIVPSYLIEYFVSMINLDDLDMTASCAYSFPAVVLTLGRENWHLLHSLLYSLCSDIQWKIRKTVAVSIYPIALIIGSELTTQDLVPIFLGFFKDLDVVKVEALRNLDDFLKVVRLSAHHNIIMALGDCLKTDNDTNWRFREELAHQVLLLIKTYGRTYNVDCMIYLTGIAFMLLTDKVNSVREIALDAIVAKFFVCSQLEVAHLTSMLLIEFGKHSHWRRRQISVMFCHKCIMHHCLNEDMISHLLELGEDIVPNVRLSVARCLKDLLSSKSLSNLSKERCIEIVQSLETLRDDCDRDVRNCADDENLIANIRNRFQQQQQQQQQQHQSTVVIDAVDEQANQLKYSDSDSNDSNESSLNHSGSGSSDDSVIVESREINWSQVIEQNANNDDDTNHDAASTIIIENSIDDMPSSLLLREHNNFECNSNDDETIREAKRTTITTTTTAADTITKHNELATMCWSQLLQPMDALSSCTDSSSDPAIVGENQN